MLGSTGSALRALRRKRGEVEVGEAASPGDWVAEAARRAGDTLSVTGERALGLFQGGGEEGDRGAAAAAAAAAGRAAEEAEVEAAAAEGEAVVERWG